jgi:hypothetical protein
MNSLRLMQRPSDQATTKRKWSADKTAGPLILLAEWLQKRLIQHAWPCRYEVIWEISPPVEDGANLERTAVDVRFIAQSGRPPLSDNFFDAFDAVLRILMHEKRLQAYRIGANLFLDGDYHVNKYGVIKPGPLPPPF